MAEGFEATALGVYEVEPPSKDDLVRIKWGLGLVVEGFECRSLGVEASGRRAIGQERG